MKILFTSIGRRVELVQCFKKAAEKLGEYLEVHGADMSETAPALFFCDEYLKVPPIRSDNYIQTLKRYCKDNCIDALVPTIDTDLYILSQNRMNFGNTKVVVSSPEAVTLCRDKRLTASFFRTINLKCPDTYDASDLYAGEFPAFIKPLDGSSSISAYKVNSQVELEYYRGIVKNGIVQNFIKGTEYTVDVFCDFDGNPVFITPRERLSVRSGEVLITRIEQDSKIIEESRTIIKSLKPCGAITIQLIRETETNNDYFIEINARFGGGSPLSMMAGADSAEALMHLIRGEKVSYKDKAAENGALFSRFDQSIRIR